MGRADVTFWLRFLRRFAVGAVLIYVGVILTLGTNPTARPVLYGSLALWFVVLVRSVRIYRRQHAPRDGPLVNPQIDTNPPDGMLHHAERDAYLQPPPSREREAGWQRGLDLLATNVAFTLVLAELALQAWAVAGGSSYLVRANLDVYRLVPGRDYGAGLIGNARGFPGSQLPAEKTTGVMRIAALGDSFAVGPAVPFADNYLTRLACELPNVEVGNFGVSSAGPREYREILEGEVWRVRPDMVLVSIFVGNDITEALPRPRALDPRRHALYLFCQRAWRLMHASAHVAAEPAVTAPERLAAPALARHVFREVEARRLSVCLKETSPGMEKKWQKALADLDAIVRACRRHEVPLRVVLIPDEFQVNDTVLEDALAQTVFHREQLDLTGPQRRLLAFFAERRVPCLDLLPAFQRVSGTYAPCDTHWNVAGNHLAASEIAVWLNIAPN